MISVIQLARVPNKDCTVDEVLIDEKSDQFMTKKTGETKVLFSRISFNKMSSTSNSTCWGYVGTYLSTNPKVDDYYELYLLNIVLNFVTSLTAILGNALVFVGILSSSNLRMIPSYWLISSQVLTDFSLGLSQPVLSAYMALEIQGKGNDFCALAVVVLFLCFFLLTATGIGLAALSMDRFLAIRLKTRYKTVVTRRRIAICIGIKWTSSFVISIIAILLNNHKTTSIMFFCYLAITSTIIWSSYVNAIRLLRAHIQDISPSQDRDGNQTNLTIDVHKYQRSLWTMFVLVIISVVFGIPLGVSWIYLYKEGLNVRTMTMTFTATTFMNLNSSMNPLIYIFRMNDIKRACRALLQKLRQAF